MKSLVTITFATALLVASLSAVAGERHVDCNKGQSLQEAIDKTGSSAAPLTINVSGTCFEDITIARDRLAINGSGDAKIAGRVRIFGARATLRDLTITAPSMGLSASGGRTRLLDVHFVDNDGPGLELTGNAVVLVRGGSINSNAGAGIFSISSVLDVSDALITSNEGNGIEALMSQITISGETRIESNDVHGVNANLHSSLLMDGPVVVTANDASGIRIEYDSGLLTFGPIEITGNGEIDAVCGDTESSAVFNDNLPTTILCSDFDW
jgi:hypothetical protein